MKHENKVMLMGNLGRDPEMRYMPDGTAIANFSMATTKSWKDKEGNKNESTEWHKVTAFGPIAELVGSYLRKGSPVKIEGSLRTRKWENKEGVTMYTTEILMNDLNLLETKSDRTKRENYADKADSNSENSKNNATVPTEDFDDDIPF